MNFIYINYQKRNNFENPFVREIITPVDIKCLYIDFICHRLEREIILQKNIKLNSISLQNENNTSN